MVFLNQSFFPPGRVLAVASLILGSFSSMGAVINWTNTSGGNWSNAANWSPNQVPLPTDTAILNTNLAGPLTVPASNVLNWVDGIMSGQLNISSNAALNWYSECPGALLFLSRGSLTVAQGGTLTISNVVTFGCYGSGFLTNYGTVIAVDGSYIGSADGGSVIYNEGLWEAGSDSLMDNHDTNTFINDGILQQTGGGDFADPAYIDWNFVSDGGTLGPPGAYFYFGDWTGNGLVGGDVTILGTLGGTIASGAVFNFYGSLYIPVTISSNAVLNLNGSDDSAMTLSPNAVVNLTGSITGTVIISSNAVLNWFNIQNYYDGSYGANLTGGSLTVAQGGTLTITNGADIDGGFLTNYGTVVEDENDPYPGILGSGGSVIYNAGVWLAAPFMDLFTQSGSNTFINAGILEGVTSGGYEPYVFITWNFISDGGTLGPSGASFELDDWTGSGLVGGDATIFGTLGGTIASGAVLNFDGSIIGPMTVSSNAVLNWFNGENSGAGNLGANLTGGSLTVAQGGTLTISNGANISGGFLTNYGTVIEDDDGGGLYGSGESVIYNAGLWLAAPYMDVFTQSGSNTFINTGNLEGVTSGGYEPYVDINWNFVNNGGTVAAAGGAVIFGGAYSGTSTASLSISLGGSTPGYGYGVIQFANLTSFLGGLQVSTENGFIPVPGSVFQVLTYPSSTGGLGCMNLDLGGGLLLQPQFSRTGLAVTVTNYDVGASQPQLFSAVVPNGLFLQWPASFTGWVLESTTNLAAPVWPAVAVSCGNNTVVPETGSQQFFRLQNEN